MKWNEIWLQEGEGQQVKNYTPLSTNGSHETFDCWNGKFTSAQHCCQNSWVHEKTTTNGTRQLLEKVIANKWKLLKREQQKTSDFLSKLLAQSHIRITYNT